MGGFPSKAFGGGVVVDVIVWTSIAIGVAAWLWWMIGRYKTKAAMWYKRLETKTKAKEVEIPVIGDGQSKLFFLQGPTLSHDFTDSEGEDAPSADPNPTSSLPPADLSALKDVTSWVVSSDGYSTDSSSETNADSIIIEGKQFIRNEEGVFMDKNGDELLPQEEDELLDLIRDSLNELKQFGGEQLPEI
jgi:hypothetical protein